MEIELDWQDMTAEELWLLEEHAGVDAVSSALGGTVTLRVYLTLLWLAMRREDRNLALRDVLERKQSELPTLRLKVSEANPTGAAGS